MANQLQHHRYINKKQEIQKEELGLNKNKSKTKQKIKRKKKTKGKQRGTRTTSSP
jgi:hypothetical protein